MMSHPCTGKYFLPALHVDMCTLLVMKMVMKRRCMHNKMILATLTVI